MTTIKTHPVTARKIVAVEPLVARGQMMSPDAGLILVLADDSAKHTWLGEPGGITPTAGDWFVEDAELAINFVAPAAKFMSAPLDPRLVDHARVILDDAPLEDSTKAALWEIWHYAPTVSALARRLAECDIPEALETRMLEAKKASSEPIAPPVDAATAAISRMAQIDPKVLDAAEKHLNALKALIGAASKE
jgi:hypothetical protein